MYREYRDRCLQERFNPGDVFVWQAPDTTIFNLGTQKIWRMKADPDAIRHSLSAMIALAEEMGIKTIGLLRIGAGLGGLDSEMVKDIITEVASNSDRSLIVFERYP